VIEPPKEASIAFADHVLALHISGTGRLRREVGGRSVEGRFGPGAINLLPAGVEARWSGTGGARSIVVAVPPSYLSRVISESWGAEPRGVEIIGQFLIRDPVIETVLMRLTEEARAGARTDRLYAEHASEFLAHHIIHAYSSLAVPPERFAGGLARHRLRAVTEYIAANLAAPISLYGLAEVAATSPRHFERAFRQATGVPPHAYVLQQRVAAARDLLSNQPRLSVRQIAARVGFSSASHLAAIFRRHTGVSPMAFRRLR
jgi:AraC family transcriptional regulator